MSGRIGKIAPTAIVAAVLGYWCWPYVNESIGRPQDKKENKLPVISAALLSPAPEAAPDRDPFRPPGEKKSSAAMAGPTKKPTLADANALGSQVLNATYIHGDRRLALISGHVYVEGEQLKGPSGPPLTVARICPERVLLQREGVTLELKYASVPPRSAAGATPSSGGPPTNKAPEVATKTKR
jgi:hypothetical protein